MVDCPNVTLGAIVMDDAADSDGIKWTPSWPIEGWETPVVRQTVMALVGADGAAVGNSGYAQRSLVLRGTASWGDADPALYWLAQDKLADATDTLETPTTLIVGETTPKQAAVRRTTTPQRFAPLGSFQGMTFQIPLIARDPRKYATTLTTQDVLDNPYTNAGRYRTPPTIEVTAWTGTTLVLGSATDDGKTVTLNATSAVGPIVVDFAAQQVTDNGVPADEMVQAGSRWWQLLPGDNTLSFGTVTDGEVRWRSAWA